MKLLKQLLKGVGYGAVVGALAFAYYTTERIGERLVVQESQSKVVKIALVFREGGKAHKYIGSGALISADGSILTCAHLFGREGRIYVKTASGQTYLAQIVRVDHKVDLAVIKIAAPQAFPYFTLGKKPFVGERVMAYGSPLDIQGTVSFGYIENLNQSDAQYTIVGAPINPGNSGGPLVDMNGQLIGVNVAVLLLNPFQIAQGMGLTVNLATIREFVRL